MGWMTRVSSLVTGGVAKASGVSWLPYAAIGGVAFVIGVSGYSYMKGYSAAEKKALSAINKALTEQLATLEVKHAKNVKIQIKATKAELEIKHAVQDLAFPEIDPHCRESLNDWMRAFNDGVRAAATD